MADAPAPISSSPSMPPAPYDAASNAPTDRWVKVQDDPPGGSEALWSTEFPVSPPWQQT
jgi:hypothetical protein